MKDDVSAVIDGQAPAALSAGEYVIPADVVALIGDGNTDAGVEVLDSAIAELRQAKTGQKEQPNPMAELFSGGKVKGKYAYAEGGKVRIGSEMEAMGGEWIENPEKELARLTKERTRLEEMSPDLGGNIVRGIMDLGASMRGMKSNNLSSDEQFYKDKINQIDFQINKLNDYIKRRDRKHPEKKYASGGKVMQDVNKNQKIAPPKEPPNSPSLSAIMKRLVGGIA